jgi:catechol 2,3-dioxygenase-like lactoylglutathione lyase family enzyme
MSNLRHVGIVVEDIETAKLLWLEAFGFTVKNDQVEFGKEIESLLGLQGAHLRSLKMSSPDSSSVVELIQFLNPIPLLDNKSHIVNRTGITHIALTVKNIEEMLNHLALYDVKSVGELSLSKNKKSKGVYVKTSCGVLIELVEEL